jgi:hypothetical protein
MSLRSGDESFVFSPRPRPFYYLSFRLAGDFAGLNAPEVTCDLVDGVLEVNIIEKPASSKNPLRKVEIQSPHRLCEGYIDSFRYFFQYLGAYKPQPSVKEPYLLPQERPHAVMHDFGLTSLMLSDDFGCLICAKKNY